MAKGFFGASAVGAYCSEEENTMSCFVTYSSSVSSLNNSPIQSQGGTRRVLATGANIGNLYS